MKFAVSNIAWNLEEEAQLLPFFRQQGVTGIEVAPTKLWPEWVGATCLNARTYRSKMANEGFELPAMQALLFNKAELQLFNPACHPAFLEHISFVAELANALGVKIMVFGSPKNRKRGELSSSVAEEIAADFFRKAGALCLERNCALAIEPNPAGYECDFITNVAEAKHLVETTDHEGFQLHIDSGAIYMNGGDIGDILGKAGEFSHYHISEPQLAPICNGVVNHARGLSSLTKLSYKGWHSIEMKKPISQQDLVYSVRYIATLKEQDASKFI